MSRIFCILIPFFAHGFINLPETLDDLSLLEESTPLELTVNPHTTHVYANDQVFLAKENDPVHPTMNLAASKLLTKEEDQALLEQWSTGFADPFPAFGRCSTVEQEVSPAIDLYIIVDICPTSDECKVLRAWSLQLQEYVRNQYDAACRLHFIADPDCRHFFSIIQDINWQVNNPDLVFLSAHEPWHPSFTAHPESLSYAVNVISRGRRWIKHFVDLEYKAKITEHFDFFICGEDDETCMPGTETSSGIVQLGVITDLIKYSNLRIVKEFRCPQVANSVPVEFYYEGKHHCACRCPAGYELNDASEGNRACIRIRNKCKCRWLNQCYEYKVTSEWRDKPCEIHDWHSRDGLVPIPMVLDNYVGFKINPSDYEDNGVGKSLNQPCVQLSIEDIDIKPNPQVFTVDYSWKYFQENRYYIFNSISITHAGRYRLTIRAFDYGSTPASCSIIIAVVDKHPPYSALSEKCPEGKEFGDSKYFGAELAEFTKENAEAAQDLVDDFQLWYGARSNDMCGERPNDDCLNYPEQFFLQKFSKLDRDQRQVEIDIAGADDCFILTPTDLDFLRTDFWLNFDADTVRPQAQYCTKCCRLDHTFSEYYYKYRCKQDGALTEYCQKGEGCDFDQCLRAEKNTFFESHHSIKNDPKPYVDDTEDIINNYREQGYNSVDEIHLVYDCTPQGDLTEYGDCDNFHNFNEMFNLEVSFVNDFAAGLFLKGSLSDTSEFIRWRYKVQGSSSWNYYDPVAGQEYNFNSHFSRRITFEAFSACGKICTIEFTVFLHIRTPIKVCESFNSYAFYQTSNFQPTSNFCNYPRADWAELTFDWNPAEFVEEKRNRKDRHLNYYFKRMECDVCLDDTEPIRNLIVWEKSERYLDRYAILLSEYPTQESTHLTWTCRVTYEDHAGASTTVSCPHEMDFYDCDPPQIDCPWSECQVDCPEGEQHPYQICGGNQLFKSDADTTSFSTAGKTCCTNCNTKPEDTSCASMFSFIDENSLYYCQVGSHQHLESFGVLRQRTFDESKLVECEDMFYHDKQGACTQCPPFMTAAGTNQNSIDDCYCALPNHVQIGRECFLCDTCIEDNYLVDTNFIQVASVSGRNLDEFQENAGPPTRYEGAGDPNACPTSTTGWSFGEFPGEQIRNDLHFNVRYNSYKLSKLSVDLIDFGDFNSEQYTSSEVTLEALPTSLNLEDSYESVLGKIGVIYGDACYNPPDALAMADWHGQETLEVTGNNIEGAEVKVKTVLEPAVPGQSGAVVDYFGDRGSAFSKICYTVDFTCNTLSGAGNCYDIPEHLSPWEGNTFALDAFDYDGCVALCKSKGHCWGVDWKAGAVEPPFGTTLLSESGTYPPRCTLLFGDFPTRDCHPNPAEEKQCAVANAPVEGDNDPEPEATALFVPQENLCYVVPDTNVNAIVHLYTYSLKDCRNLCNDVACEAFEYHFRDELVDPSERKCVIILNRGALTSDYCNHAVTYIRKPPPAPMVNFMKFPTASSGASVALLGVIISCIVLFVGKTFLQEQQMELPDSYEPLL